MNSVHPDHAQDHDHSGSWSWSIASLDLLSHCVDSDLVVQQRLDLAVSRGQSLLHVRVIENDGFVGVI